MSSILPISKKMIVDNRLIVQPRIDDVSASIESEAFEEHNITSAGVYGEISAKTNTLNTEYRNNIIDATTRCYDVKLNKLNSVLTAGDTNILDIVDQAVSVQELETLGVFYDNTRSHSFEIEKIKEKFLIDDSNLRKKKSILNLFDYHYKNFSSTGCHNLNWGFGNYNTINFFTLGNKVSDTNTGIQTSKTHKNVLLYPNIKNTQNKQAYDFSNSSGNYSFCFYINPRYTNREDYYFNPGCVFNVPGLISIYLIEGTNKDENDGIDSYRLYIELFEKTLEDLQDNFVLLDEQNNIPGFDITSTLGQTFNNKLFLSKDDYKIKKNSWAHIAVSINHIGEEFYNLKIYIDGKESEDYSAIATPGYSFPDFSSFISIGNKYQIQTTNEIYANFIDWAFSSDKEIENDTIGPYVKKHISMGQTFNSVIDFPPTPVINYNLKNQLNNRAGVFIDQTTSLALHAELHDLRIYNKKIDFIKISEIKDQAVNDLASEKEAGLIFYVPVYCFPQEVKKNSIVNLNTDSDLINKHNVGFTSINNIYFENFTGGYDLNSEIFLREFIDHVQPNVAIGGNVQEDFYENVYNFSLIQSTPLSDINDKVRQGSSPLEIIDQITYNLTSADNDAAVAAGLQTEFYFLNSPHYKNNLILPNDNGLQKQHYHVSLFESISEELKNRYFKNNLSNAIDFSVVLLDQNISKTNAENSFSYDNSKYRLGLTSESIINDRILSGNPGQRQFTFETGKKIDSCLDKLYDISKINFYSSGFSYTSEVQNNLKFGPNVNDKLTISDFQSFYKTYSNPASRNIGASYSSSIGNSILFTKNLRRDDEFISYKNIEMPLYKSRNETLEFFSTVLGVSTQIYNGKIKKGSLEIYDYNLGGTLGAVRVKLADNYYSGIYRADCLTPHAKWNKIGNVLYEEGFLTILHPGLENFARNNFGVVLDSFSEVYVKELNLPINAQDINDSRNPSYIKELKLDDSSFNADESFVYVSDINLHDENLNIIAKARLTQPFPKKESDNLLVRLKMDF